MKGFCLSLLTRLFIAIRLSPGIAVIGAIKAKLSFWISLLYRFHFLSKLDRLGFMTVKHELSRDGAPSKLLS